MEETIDRAHYLLSGYNLAASAWEACADLPMKRYAHAAVALDENRMLVVGGCITSSGEGTDTTIVYDKRTNEWASSGWPRLQANRSNHAAVIVNHERVFVLGGLGGNNTCLDSIECLDLHSSPLQWRKLNMKLSEPRYLGTAVAIGTDVYYIGGWNLATGNQSATVDIMDTCAGHVCKGPDLLFSEAEHCASVVNGTTIVLIGGQFYGKQHALMHTLPTNCENAQWKPVVPVAGLTDWNNRSAVTIGDSLVMCLGGYEQVYSGLEAVEWVRVLDMQRMVLLGKGVSGKCPDYIKMQKMLYTRRLTAAAMLGDTVVVAGGLGKTTNPRDLTFKDDFVAEHKLASCESLRLVKASKQEVEDCINKLQFHMKKLRQSLNPIGKRGRRKHVEHLESLVQDLRVQSGSGTHRGNTA